MSNVITHHESGGVTFAGPESVKVYVATVVASALRFYANTGMRLNTAYTPTRMLKKATEITGQKFKRGQYMEASLALRTWAHNKAQVIQEMQDANTD